MSDNLSLAQLHVFNEVATHGSMAAAATALGSSASSVAYALDVLEAQLCLALFDRSGYRLALSPEGRALLPRVRVLLREVCTVHAEARGLSQGIESTLTLIHDGLYPVERIVQVLAQFEAQFPDTCLQLRMEPVLAAQRIMLEGGEELGLMVDFTAHDPDLVIVQQPPITLVAVAAPTHSLATSNSSVCLEMLRDQLQLVMGNTDEEKAEGPDRGVLSLRTWRMNDLDTKQRLLRAGLGWGSLPYHRAAPDIEQNKLVELHLSQWDGTDRMPSLPACLAYRRSTPRGPAARWLIASLNIGKITPYL